MEEETFKIGEEIEITKDVNFKTIGGRNIEIKKGDRGYFNSKEHLNYTSGNGKGLIQATGLELKGYDISNITNMIYIKLDKRYSIGELLENEDIEKEDFIDEIRDVLSDIL